MISIGTTNSSTKVSYTIRNVLEGHAAILLTGSSNVMTVSIPGSSKRSIEEASYEPVIRGPRDGFIEQISTLRHVASRDAHDIGNNGMLPL
ncbi:hypothetical protein QFZ77_004826 [Paenibacillus sp. V4I3]|nr:hypothetical protein [Paenibacillus sp. V4I3]MDQ0887795.1 hypothetical protein [Paenibacillus sp. V4I9]